MKSNPIKDFVKIYCHSKVLVHFPTKNHPQTSVLKLEKPSENNRSQCLSKNNRTDCDVKNVQKPSTSHRCYKKNNGIASLSKIDHRWSLVQSSPRKKKNIATGETSQAIAPICFFGKFCFKGFFLSQNLLNSSLCFLIRYVLREAINKKSHLSIDTFRTSLSPPPPGSTDA